MPKSSKPANQVPAHVSPLARDASSSADVMVGPGVGLTLPLVPSQGCGPSPLSIGWPSVVTGPSNNVALAPSTRSWTVVGAAEAALHASNATAAVASARDLMCILSLPFLEGSWWLRPEADSWLPGLPSRLPRRRCLPVASAAVSRTAPGCDGRSRSQWRDRAGLSPDFPLAPLAGAHRPERW